MGDSTIACDFSDSDLKPIYYLIESAARRLLTPDSLRESPSTLGYFPTMIKFRDVSIRMRNDVQSRLEPSSGISRCYHLTRGPRSPVRIVIQVQWFMYLNQSEPSSGI